MSLHLNPPTPPPPSAPRLTYLHIFNIDCVNSKGANARAWGVDIVLQWPLGRLDPGNED